jgi:hypothetical protein
VPVWIENLNRVMPKGEVVPVPLLCTVTFGAPMHLEPGEDKTAFLDRASAALLALRPAREGRHERRAPQLLTGSLGRLRASSSSRRSIGRRSARRAGGPNPVIENLNARIARGGGWWRSWGSPSSPGGRGS